MTIPEALPDPQPIAAGEPGVQSSIRVYTPRKGSKVEQLHALYADAKARKAAAEKRLDAITAAIKSELDQHRVALAGPDAKSIDFVSPAGPPLRMTWVVTNRFDGTAFGKKHPTLKAEFTKPSGSWRLAEIKDES